MDSMPEMEGQESGLELLETLYTCTRIALDSMEEGLKMASKKERREYKPHVKQLKQIHKALRDITRKESGAIAFSFEEFASLKASVVSVQFCIQQIPGIVERFEPYLNADRMEMAEGFIEAMLSAVGQPKTVSPNIRA